MSAYIVSDETITAIARGFVEYGVRYKAEGYEPEIRIIVDRKAEIEEIGQNLLHWNYYSVNGRYHESRPTPVFKAKEIEFNEGILLGCIDCYIYQASEPSDFFETDLYASLLNLKAAMLNRLIREKKQNIPWGYEA